jgi:general secretion pathway protein J
MSAARPTLTRGFTLVEVLVALVIMAVLATMAWQGIDGVARSRELAQQRMERTLRLNTVLEQFQYDLDALHDTTAVPAFAFDGATLRLVRRAEGGVQIVSWSLRGSEWLRWAGPVVTRITELQDQWMRSQQLLGTEPGQVRTLTGVGDWQLYCYRGNAWSNCQSSADVTSVGTSPATPGGTPGATPGTAPPRAILPTGVRSVMTLAEGTLTRDLMLSPQLQ